MLYTHVIDEDLKNRYRVVMEEKQRPDTVKILVLELIDPYLSLIDVEWIEDRMEGIGRAPIRGDLEEPSLS